MKKFLIVMAVMGAAYLSQASYLYWQVSSEAVNDYASGEGTYGVQVTYNNNALTIYDTYGKSVGTVVGTTMAQNPGYLVDITDFTSGSYYIELVKYNTANREWDTVGVSTGIAYTDVGSYTVDLNAVAPTLPVAWTGGSYAAPEPTSAMLMLIGMAGLALKRRKA